MKSQRSTRGNGFLENFLASQRAKMANRLILPAERLGRILDIGCGSYPSFLTGTDFAEKFGIDKSVEPVRGLPGLTLCRSDFESSGRLPFGDAYFEVVTMLAVFEHIEPPKLLGLLNEIDRVLKPLGSLILTIPAGWTDGLLRTMAKVGLVSREEIEEHKAAYSFAKVREILQKTAFNTAFVESGSFECFMNMWFTVRKAG